MSGSRKTLLGVAFAIAATAYQPVVEAESVQSERELAQQRGDARGGQRGNDGRDNGGQRGNNGGQRGNNGRDNGGQRGNDGRGNDGRGNDGRDNGGWRGNDGRGNDGRGNDGWDGNDGRDNGGWRGDDGRGNDGWDGNDGRGNDGWRDDDRGWRPESGWTLDDWLAAIEAFGAIAELLPPPTESQCKNALPFDVLTRLRCEFWERDHEDDDYEDDDHDPWSDDEFGDDENGWGDGAAVSTPGE